MNKRYIPLLITLLLLGMISGDIFGQDFGGQRRDRSQAPRRERQAKVKMETVESVVKDDSGQPIPNVLISGKEGAIEVMTDSQGQFKINVPEGTDLLFESEGLETKVISLKEGVPATVTMQRAPFLMEERNTVNIAFGQVKRKDLIGAVTTLDPKEMKKYDDTQDFFSALRGKITGLRGTNNIRGLGTSLVIIDGVPRNPQFLNLDEVEQVSVLKDGNAAMLWGSLAQNGVIQITTRRGTPYKRKIEVTVEKGFSNPVALPKYLGSADYMSLYNEARGNDGLSPLYSESTISNYAGSSNPYEYPSVNYYSSEYLRSNRPFSRVLTEMSGGNANTKYYANVGWNRTGTLFELGQAKQMHEDRFNMRGNVDFQVNEFIKAAIDAVVVFDFNKQPNGNFWGIASTNHPNYFSPLLPISMMEFPALYPQIKTAQKIYGDYLLGGTAQYTVNPYGIMYYAGDNTDNQRTAQMNATVEADLKNLTEGLKFRAYLSFDVYNRYSVQTNPSYSVYTPTWQTSESTDYISALNQTGTDFNSGEQSLPTSVVTYNGLQTVTPYFERRVGTNLQLDYDRTFDDVHHVTGTLLAYWQRFKYNNITIDDKDAHLGLRLTYAYKQKYLVDFTSTYTNGFHLAPGHMGGYAPSLAVAWNMSEEDFMEDYTWIDFLKLRASATIQNIDPTNGLRNSTTGSQEWHPYWESFQNGSSISWNDVNVSRSARTVNLIRSANYGLTFEKMKSINVGLEGWFFNRTLYLEGNFFTNRWTGQVIRGTSVYSSWVGNNSSYINYNETGYTGGELGITLAKAYGKFSYEVNVNGLYSTSKAVKVSEIHGEPYQYRTGKSADAIFGLEALGLFQDQAEIDASPAPQFGTPAPGDIKYKDINGDNKVDGTDAVQIGNYQPKFSYGLNLVLTYGSFSLMATADGQSNFNYMLSGEYFQVAGNDKYSAEVLNRWTPETAATATYPRLSTTSSSNNFQTSTYWMQKGNYLRLNRVQLTWDVPRKLIQTWPTKEISLYVRGSNLQMWSTKQVQRQLNIGGEPNYRSYALGVNILF